MKSVIQIVLIAVLAAVLIGSVLSFAADPINKDWLGTQTVAQTNAYGGAVADLAADAAYDYTNNIDLFTAGYEGTQIMILFFQSLLRLTGLLMTL
jgi:hypothetical protein